MAVCSALGIYGVWLILMAYIAIYSTVYKQN